MEADRKREYDRLRRNIVGRFERGNIPLDVMWQALCELDDEYL
jgi:hypothetical protein